MHNNKTRRAPFQEEHALYREQVRRFVAAEMTPFHAAWEESGVVDRALWHKAGATGVLCPSLSEDFGGGGGDFLHSVVVIEEQAYAGTTGPGFFVHSEMVTPYIVNFGTEAQKARWLPKLACGEVVGAVGMTEPGAGSDLRGLRTLARRVEGGWTLNGQKVFISNGQLADLVVVAAKTDAADKNSLSLFLVDTTSAGFRRGKNLKKIGGHAQDTSELFFDDVFVPDDCLLGAPGEGFRQLMKGLARERLAIAVTCQARAEAALHHTVAYVKERMVFGKTLSDFQNTRFQVAEMSTEVQVGRAFVDDALCRYLDGQLDAVEAAMAKLWTSEMLGRIVDKGVQLHGGWGYMEEYPIAREYASARVQRIVGGSSEIMKEIIGRQVFESTRA